ncbi:hypothetical protein Glove_152g37 [Diversispora epigaea]|uniref:Translation initiation factor IF-2, mitochondrial n=1 Tax=Diversispora epigaea TaxID=1348612 RepID=A0A397IX91_9GLOM|nr:hypothetical protein Glove_152g37 [Diversispora epigaea]
MLNFSRTRVKIWHIEPHTISLLSIKSYRRPPIIQPGSERWVEVDGSEDFDAETALRNFRSNTENLNKSKLNNVIIDNEKINNDDNNNNEEKNNTITTTTSTSSLSSEGINNDKKNEENRNETKEIKLSETKWAKSSLKESLRDTLSREKKPNRNLYGNDDDGGGGGGGGGGEWSIGRSEGNNYNRLEGNYRNNRNYNNNNNNYNNNYNNNNERPRFNRFSSSPSSSSSSTTTTTTTTNSKFSSGLLDNLKFNNSGGIGGGERSTRRSVFDDLKLGGIGGGNDPFPVNPIGSKWQRPKSKEIFNRSTESKSQNSGKSTFDFLQDNKQQERPTPPPPFNRFFQKKQQTLPSLGKSKELISQMEPPEDVSNIVGEISNDIEQEKQRARQKFGMKKDKAVTSIESRKFNKTMKKENIEEEGEEEDFDMEFEFERSKKKKQPIIQELPKIKKEIYLPEAISVSNLAKLIGERLAPFEQKLRVLGIEYTTHDHLLNAEEASLIAMEYDLSPVVNSEAAIDLYSKPIPNDMSKYPLRPPIVTIMGHVDHGKTTLLDSLRKSTVAAGEAGGITQHIGAFSVTLPSKKTITFLDTPGHAAFSAMRARGAHVTDIVVLVVAADDGIMPQTIEAIKHAKDAGVPMVVAINKIDRHDANASKVRESLLAHGVELEEYNGDTQSVEISALKSQGLDVLEESIITLAELSEYRAEVDIEAEGNIIESQVERGKGNVATILVKRGTLKQGDNIVAGTSWCKVRLMTNDKGESLKEALPGTPVKVMGWKNLPKAGDEVLQAKDEELAKIVVNNRLLKEERERQIKDLEVINEKRRQRKKEIEEKHASARNFKKEVWMFHKGLLKEYPTMESPFENKEQESSEEEKIKQLSVIVKADVSGSVEAVVNSLDSMGNDEVCVNVIDFGVGDINESDVIKASASKSLIYGFNVKANSKVMGIAQSEHVDIITHNIIYKLLDDVKLRLSQMLPPIIETHVMGEATILKIFEINIRSKEFKSIAGCRITDGIVTKNQKVRVMRNDLQVWEGFLESLKQVKTDIPEAKKGLECGMSFEGFKEFKEGDTIQSITIKEVPRSL